MEEKKEKNMFEIKKMREKIGVDKLKAHSKNPKLHNIKLIQKSISNLGFVDDVVIDENNVILGGHGRIKALKELGVEDVEVIRVSNWSEEQKEKYLLVANQSTLSGGMEEDKVKLFSGDILEFSGLDSDILLTPEDKDDDVPEVVETPKSKLGDIYQLGEHRIVCGDSTDKKNIEELFKNKKAKIIFTSPPYNIDGDMYNNYEDNLKREEYIDFNLNIINKWKEFLYGFVFWNISYNKNARDEFIEILYRIIKETGLKFLELVVWNKRTAIPVVSKEMFTRTYEDIIVVGNEDSIKKDMEMGAILRNSKEAFFNTKTRKWLNNYWEITVNKTQLDNHKACYPVELPLKAILIMVKENEIVADPFLGSGSTLIACEKSNRICYGMELDPKYVDVCIERWCKYTGINKVIKNDKEIIWKN